MTSHGFSISSNLVFAISLLFDRPLILDKIDPVALFLFHLIFNFITVIIWFCFMAIVSDFLVNSIFDRNRAPRTARCSS